jgi:uncharacterized protein (DUF1697 family)
MVETGPEYTPEHASVPGGPRRGLFRRPPTITIPDATIPPPPADARLTEEEREVAHAIERTIDEHLEQGLHALEEQATVLMREIAGEMWRASGADARPEQERIVSLLSRDQTIKSLLASSDERFQALAVRSARLEDNVQELAETGRVTRDSMEAATAAIRTIADSPTLHGVDSVRSQLEQVEAHIAQTFQHLDERDRTLGETILRQVREHGDLVSRETARIVEAMQGYVQGGTEAMGHLAQRVEQHAEAFATQDIHIANDVRAAIAEQTEPLQQQLELVSERVGLHGRAQDEVRTRLEALIDARMLGLAQLVRSDSNVLRTMIEARPDPVALDGSAVVVDTEAIAEATAQQVAVRLTSAELRLEGLMEKMMDTQLMRIGEQVEARLADHLESRFSSMAEIVAQRAAEAADIAIASSFSTEAQSATEDRLMSHIDDRMTAVARLVRSDNQALADRLDRTAQAMAERPAPSSAPADAELARETLRTLKELQAGLAGDMVGSMDARFRVVSDQLHTETQSTAEAMIKVAEVLGEKIDRLTVRVDEGYGSELQVVIDRMSDAIQAMSVAGRRSA